MEKTEYPVGSDISIPCDVDGYPVPKVAWYKDGKLLQSSDRIQISGKIEVVPNYLCLLLLFFYYL